MATIVNGNSYYDSGFETATNKEKSDWHLTKISFKGDELTFSVMARRNFYTNGQTNSFYQTNGTKFYLLGVVVYK